MNNLHFRWPLIALLVELCNLSVPTQADPTIPSPHWPKVAIMMGTYYYKGPVLDEYTDVRVTGESQLKIRQVMIRPSLPGRGLDARLTTDRDILPTEQKNLVVKVKDKLFVASPLGPGSNHLWLSHIDEKSAKILTDGKLAPAPRERFKVEFTPVPQNYKLGQSALEQPVLVKITVTNIGKKPLQFLGTSDGQDDYPGHDVKIFAGGTQSGLPIACDPIILPRGYVFDHRISPPVTIKPNSAIEKTIDLKHWLTLNQLGTYEINVLYIIYIINPKADGLLQEWAIDYPTHLSIELR